MVNTQMITNSPTFCPAPWTSLNIDQTGRVMPCFHTGYELGNIKHIPIQQVLIDKPLQDLRQTMARGEWHDACAWCKRLEETTGTSGRTVRHADSNTLAAIDNDLDFFKLEHLVINWSNLCNLTCVYCNPETSTAWQSIKRIPINHVKNEHEDLIELARTQGHNIQGLSLGGGEPLLQKGLDKFLNYINPDKVRVMVTTNLSVELSTNPIYQMLKNWPSVDWMISFDNADKEKFEYVRDGASWEQFVKNLRQMKKDNQHVLAHPAYSIYCALDLEEYYDFCDQENLSIFWCELNHPEDLDMRRQPMALRQLAIDEIDRVVAKYKHCQHLAVDALERYRLTLQDNSYLLNIHHTTNVQVFHQNIEAQLKKSVSFADLWPTIVNTLS
jgi:radical SAM protein with 4Fe4S-binding SPASM domain